MFLQRAQLLSFFLRYMIWAFVSKWNKSSKKTKSGHEFVMQSISADNAIPIFISVEKKDFLPKTMIHTFAGIYLYFQRWVLSGKFVPLDFSVSPQCYLECKSELTGGHRLRDTQSSRGVHHNIPESLVQVQHYNIEYFWHVLGESSYWIILSLIFTLHLK